jgi:predicted amidohydrolase YtcJ
MTLLNSEALSADMVLLHGKVVTIDSKDTLQEAVAIKAGRIIGTGSSSEMKQFAGGNTEVIDLMGKPVLPGIIDSHTHPSFAATRFLEIDCRAPEIQGIEDIQNDVLKMVK